MELTHLGHSCVLVDTGSARLLIDPGTLSTGFEQLTGLDAVLVTHQHPDHLDPARLPALLAANPSAALIVDEGSGPQVAGLGLSARVLRTGDRARIAGADIAGVGGLHAIIHVDIPRIPNTGYVIDDGAFYHPGDSFVVPDSAVDVLAVPASAPWLKLSEAVDFMRAIAPRAAVPVHEAMLADPALPYSLLAGLAPPTTTFVVLDRNQARAM